MARSHPGLLLSLQLVSKSTKTRAWLLSHALERHLGALESLMPAGSAQGRSLASTKQSVDAGAIAKAIAAPAELDYGQELVDCVNDVVCEFTARHGRLAQSDGLAGPEMARVDLMVAELGQWLSSGATAAAAARDGHASPWRHSESYVHHDQLSRRWSTVFAQEGAVHQLLDIFDEDDVEALKEKVTRGLPVDIIVDGVSESALMAAAARNASTCTEFLLEQGATVRLCRRHPPAGIHALAFVPFVARPRGRWMGSLLPLTCRLPHFRGGELEVQCWTGWPFLAARSCLHVLLTFVDVMHR